MLGVNRSTYAIRIDTSPMIEIGDRIKALRKAKGIRQAELAKKAGIKQPSLSDIERNETKSLKASTLLLLAKALETSPDHLRTGRGSPSKPIDTNAVEAEVVSVYQKLTPAHRRAWVEIGHVLIHAQAPHSKTLNEPAPTANALTVERQQQKTR